MTPAKKAAAKKAAATTAAGKKATAKKAAAKKAAAKKPATGVGRAKPAAPKKAASGGSTSRTRTTARTAPSRSAGAAAGGAATRSAGATQPAKRASAATTKASAAKRTPDATRSKVAAKRVVKKASPPTRRKATPTAKKPKAVETTRKRRPAVTARPAVPDDRGPAMAPAAPVPAAVAPAAPPRPSPVPTPAPPPAPDAPPAWPPPSAPPPPQPQQPPPQQPQPPADVPATVVVVPADLVPPAPAATAPTRPVEDDGPADREIFDDAPSADDEAWPAAPRRSVAWHVRRTIAVYVASRLVVLLAFATAALMKGHRPITEPLGAWDVGWYVRIAANGYPTRVPIVDGHAGQSEIAFFPGYPLAMRWVDQLTPLDAVLSGAAISLVSGCLAAIGMWFLARRLTDRETADRSVTLFCFFPASFFVAMAYSEGLMLAFAVWCLHALLMRRWLAAGVASAVATMIRPNAVGLCFACLAASVGAIRRRREWRSVVAVLLSPLGFLGFVAYTAVHTGDVMSMYETQRYGWEHRMDFGVNTWRAVVRVFDNHPLDVNAIVSTVTMVFTIVALVALWRWRPPAALTAYAVFVAVVPFLSAVVASRPRYVFTAFPLLIALARWVKGGWYTAVVGCSAVLLGMYAILSVNSPVATP